MEGVVLSSIIHKEALNKNLESLGTIGEDGVVHDPRHKV
jgi:hypothetical protein